MVLQHVLVWAVEESTFLMPTPPHTNTLSRDSSVSKPAAQKGEIILQTQWVIWSVLKLPDSRQDSFKNIKAS